MLSPFFSVTEKTLLVNVSFSDLVQAVMVDIFWTGIDAFKSMQNALLISDIQANRSMPRVCDMYARFVINKSQSDLAKIDA